MKLRRKVIQGIVIANILPLMLIVGWVYSESSNQVVSRAISDMTSEHQDVANVLQLRIKTATRDVQLLRRSDIVKKYLLLEDEEVKYQIFYQAVADQLMQYLFTNDNYSEARLITQSGYEEVRVVRGNTRNIVEDNKELAWFKSVSDNIDTTDIIISDHEDFSEKSILVISHPCLLYTSPSPRD